MSTGWVEPGALVRESIALPKCVGLNFEAAPEAETISAYPGGQPPQTDYATPTHLNGPSPPNSQINFSLDSRRKCKPRDQSWIMIDTLPFILFNSYRRERNRESKKRRLNKDIKKTKVSLKRLCRHLTLFKVIIY